MSNRYWLNEYSYIDICPHHSDKETKFVKDYPGYKSEFHSTPCDQCKYETRRETILYQRSLGWEKRIKQKKSREQNLSLMQRAIEELYKD